MTWSKTKRIYLWILTFIFVSVLVSLSQFQSKSNDSKYYTNLVARYHSKDWSEILSARWGENFWGFGTNTFMRDQLPGQLVMGSILAKLGIPAAHALHLLEMGFLLGGILLCREIAFHFKKSKVFNILPAILIFLPLTFSYTIRANHEAGLFFFSTLSLYSGLRVSSSMKWSISGILACLFLMWIKGPFVIFGFLLFTWSFFISESIPKKYFSWLFTMIFSVFLVALSGITYEYFFRKWTGEPFFSVFWEIQINQRALNKATHPFIIQKILNFHYYFINYLGYSLPWTLFALFALFKFKTNERLDFLKSRLSLCFLGSSIIYLGVFSMSERNAGRYTFPGYYFFAAWIVLICLEYFKWPKAKIESIDIFKIDFLSALLWSLIVVVHLIA